MKRLAVAFVVGLLLADIWFREDNSILAWVFKGPILIAYVIVKFLRG